MSRDDFLWGVTMEGYVSPDGTPYREAPVESVHTEAFELDRLADDGCPWTGDREIVDPFPVVYNYQI